MKSSFAVEVLKIADFQIQAKALFDKNYYFVQILL